MINLSTNLIGGNMNTIKTKIETIEVGKFDVDSIVIKNDDKDIEICFDKKLNITQYIGKEVIIKNEDGVFTITEDVPVQSKK